MVCRALNRSLAADTELAGLAKLLDGAWRTVAERAANNPDLRFEIAQGKMRLMVALLDQLKRTESLDLVVSAIAHLFRRLRPPIRTVGGHSSWPKPTLQPFDSP